MIRYDVQIAFTWMILHFHWKNVRCALNVSIHNHCESDHSLLRFQSGIYLLLRFEGRHQRCHHCKQNPIGLKGLSGRALSAEIPAICLVRGPRQDPYTATTTTTEGPSSLSSSMLYFIFIVASDASPHASTKLSCVLRRPRRLSQQRNLWVRRWLMRFLRAL